MTRIAKRSIFALYVLLAFYAPLLAQTIPAKPTSYVSDFANVLDAKTRTELEAMVRQAEKDTTVEIAVVTVPSLQGATVEDYALKLFNQWGIGKKGKDNGVLLLVAPNEHKVRIQTGYGAESLLPDGKCGTIIREECLPRFKANDFNAGVMGATTRITKVLTGKEPSKSSPAPKEEVDPAFTYFKYIVFSFILFFMANSINGSDSGRRYGGRFWRIVCTFLTVVSWIIGYVYVQFFASVGIDHGQYWAFGIFTGWACQTCMWEAGVHLKEKLYKEFWIDLAFGLVLLVVFVLVAWIDARWVVYCLVPLSIVYFVWGWSTGFLDGEPDWFIGRFALWMLVFRSAFITRSDRGHAQRYGFAVANLPSSGGGSGSGGSSFGGGSSGGGGASGSW